MTENSQPSKWKEILNGFPIIQFVIAGFIGLAATWTTIQLTQNSQAAEIRRNTEKIERLEKDSVSRELFDERTKTIIEKQKETNDLIKQILEKK